MDADGVDAQGDPHRSCLRAALGDDRIIHGGCDLIGVEWARQRALLTGEAKLLVLSGATRYPWLEYPGHFTAALAHFLQPA